ncbi:hypothetical protein FHW12_000319 [Dokdonella fugitiva]|uniref:Uncharacterized protein n=1 Tax=Dokdonella fugitiva TaxID=328517 RepID=A0A839EY62_9GAMM|nr:hypothetical protein [Dokdonella fugitiva]MBA8886128.1 hypothetical protein [Dokdonella fugitiva]
MSAQHTPTPWHTGEGKAERIIYADDGFAVADAAVFHGRHVESPANNAAFIVRACNAHDELVAALRRAVEAAEARMPNATFLADARAALAKAGAP